MLFCSLSTWCACLWRSRAVWRCMLWTFGWGRHAPEMVGAWLQLIRGIGGCQCAGACSHISRSHFYLLSCDSFKVLKLLPQNWGVLPLHLPPPFFGLCLAHICSPELVWTLGVCSNSCCRLQCLRNRKGSSEGSDFPMVFLAEHHTLTAPFPFPVRLVRAYHGVCVLIVL